MDDDRLRTRIGLQNIRAPHLFTWGLILLFAGCTATEDPLRIGTIPWPGYELIHIAESLHYPEMKQVRIIEQANATQTSQSIRNGVIDAAMLTLDETLNLMQDGDDLRIVLVVDISNGADVVMVRPGIRDLQAVRGLRVGAENSAIGAVMLDALLTAAKLELSDIQLVPLSVNEHVDAFRDEKVDVIVTFDPVRTELLN